MKTVHVTQKEFDAMLKLFCEEFGGSVLDWPFFARERLMKTAVRREKQEVVQLPLPYGNTGVTRYE